MSLISEALRRAQQLKLGEGKTGIQGGMFSEIFSGSKIVVKTPKKSFLSQNRLIILGFSGLILVMSILYNSSLLQRSSGSKEAVSYQETPTVSSHKKDAALAVISAQKAETLSEKIPTLDHSAESIDFQPVPRKYRFSTGGRKPALNTPPGKGFCSVVRSEETAFAQPRENTPGPVNVESDNRRSEKNYNTLGVTYYLRGDLKQALEQFKAAIQLNPNSIEGYVNIGIVYKKQNQLQNALQVYKKAIALKPDSPEPYYNLGILYEETGDLKSATAAYFQFLRLAPSKYQPQKQKVRERLKSFK